MRLLFDQNLSFWPCERMADLFPDSRTVREIGLDRAEDRAICRRASGVAMSVFTAVYRPFQELRSLDCTRPVGATSRNSSNHRLTCAVGRVRRPLCGYGKMGPKDAIESPASSQAGWFPVH